MTWKCFQKIDLKIADQVLDPSSDKWAEPKQSILAQSYQAVPTH